MICLTCSGPISTEEYEDDLGRPMFYVGCSGEEIGCGGVRYLDPDTAMKVYQEEFGPKATPSD